VVGFKRRSDQYLVLPGVALHYNGSPGSACCTISRPSRSAVFLPSRSTFGALLAVASFARSDRCAAAKSVGGLVSGRHATEREGFASAITSSWKRNTGSMALYSRRTEPRGPAFGGLSRPQCRGDSCRPLESKPTAEHKQELASIIHLCGVSVASAFAKHRFRLVDGERCGEHDVAGTKAMKREFVRRFKSVGRRCSTRWQFRSALLGWDSVFGLRSKPPPTVSLICGEQHEPHTGCAITRPRPHPAIDLMPRLGGSAVSFGLHNS
jgi:hypothetical protein